MIFRSGTESLKLLDKARKAYNLPIITEVIDSRDVTWICEYVDILQIGARNMQNFALLKEVGKSSKPVF
jgi:3-deoxy-D-arabino-heptulosonate 7-phosphate (DAHP) synthase